MTQALISRQEAKDLIDLLMDTDGPKQMRRKSGTAEPKSKRFGRCELDELLNAIYGREEIFLFDDTRNQEVVEPMLRKLAS
jgi:hypothetical protein